MKRFAQILNSKVHYIFESEEKPVFSKEIHIVDITKNKEVQEGWDYDIYNKLFLKPEEVFLEEIVDPQEKLLAQIKLETINLLSELEVI